MGTGKLIEGIWDCPNCGADRIRASVKDCPCCGQAQDGRVKFRMGDYKNYPGQVQSKKQPTREASWVCSNCNALNDSSNKVCRVCNTYYNKAVDKSYFEVKKENSTSKVGLNIDRNSRRTISNEEAAKYEEYVTKLENETISRTISNEEAAKYEEYVTKLENETISRKISSKSSIERQKELQLEAEERKRGEEALRKIGEELNIKVYLGGKVDILDENNNAVSVAE